ncbi:uncharacterized protein LOC120689054 [Panicum virgatum]|uniref:uncharacterized protein LOC120689054 n=1 Tax=Panicum virgatum TaxID=38727 RepID=UPI0019D6471C|nr:uncharacterized protein LOC120689054 [Panicum virgatum]
MSRAAWNYNYEKGLVHIMRDHVNIPMFRGQNGWTVEGWRSILEKFNQQFPSAHFTKGQLQEKEKELKGSWKAIRDARKESGIGWNDLLSMIIAEPEKWKKLVNDNAKLARFQKKPFPLYDDCTSLYAGSVATGELNFTSTGHLAPAAQLPPAANYKKKQTGKTIEALEERKKKEEAFSVPKCLDEMDAMDGLTDVEKSYGMDIFKSEIDREVFMNMKNKNVRLIWLKRQISALGGGDV